jgi:hypothetical protein
MANTPESISHIQIGQDVHPIDAVSVGGKTLENLQSDFQLKSNIVNSTTGLSSSSTDSQYPSAKLVYDILGDLERRLGNI